MTELRSIKDLPPDPWRLTKTQRRVLVAMCDLGCSKAVAEAQFRAPATIDFHLAAVRKSMGVRHTALALLQWDRWHRSQT